MWCRNCRTRIEAEFEAHARKACPYCDEPLHETRVKP